MRNDGLRADNSVSTEPEIVLRLTPEEADLVIGLVGTGSYCLVAALVQKLIEQIEPQTREQTIRAELAAMPVGDAKAN